MTFVTAASIYAVLLCIAIFFIVGSHKANARYDKAVGNYDAPPEPQTSPTPRANATLVWPPLDWDGKQ